MNAGGMPGVTGFGAWIVGSGEREVASGGGGGIAEKSTWALGEPATGRVDVTAAGLATIEPGSSVTVTSSISEVVECPGLSSCPCSGMMGTGGTGGGDLF